jgi:hypothetical protein
MTKTTQKANFKNDQNQAAEDAIQKAMQAFVNAGNVKILKAKKAPKPLTAQ